MKRDYSGRLLIRIPKSMHRELAEGAKREGVSLNQIIVAALGGASMYGFPENMAVRALRDGKKS